MMLPRKIAVAAVIGVPQRLAALRTSGGVGKDQDRLVPRLLAMTDDEVGIANGVENGLLRDQFLNGLLDHGRWERATQDVDLGAVTI